MRAASAILLAVSTAHSREWIKITSENFELFTTAGEGNGKAAIRHFEQIRAFFLTPIKSQSKPLHRVRLAGFSSEKEFEPYRPSAAAAAYYLPTADREYIVMSTLTSSVTRGWPTSIRPWRR